MRLTGLRIHPSKGNGTSLAFGAVQFDQKISINFAVLKGRNGDIFVSWPYNTTGEGEAKKYNHQVIWDDKDEKVAVEKNILDEFNRNIGLVNSVDTSTRSASTRSDTSNSDSAPAEPLRRTPPVEWKMKM